MNIWPMTADAPAAEAGARQGVEEMGMVAVGMCRPSRNAIWSGQPPQAVADGSGYGAVGVSLVDGISVDPRPVCC